MSNSRSDPQNRQRILVTAPLLTLLFSTFVMLEIMPNPSSGFKAGAYPGKLSSQIHTSCLPAHVECSHFPSSPPREQ